MKGILALLGVVLAAAMAELLLPEKGGTGTKKYLHLLTSLAVLLLLLSPVLSLLRSAEAGELPLPEAGAIPAYEELFAEAMDEGGVAAFSDGVREAVATHFALSPADITVETELADKEPVRVLVRLSGRALTCDPRKIETYLTELLGIEVEVR